MYQPQQLHEVKKDDDNQQTKKHTINCLETVIRATVGIYKFSPSLDKTSTGCFISTTFNTTSSGTKDLHFTENQIQYCTLTAVFSCKFLVNDYVTSIKVKIQFDHFRS